MNEFNTCELHTDIYFKDRICPKCEAEAMASRLESANNIRKDLEDRNKDLVRLLKSGVHNTEELCLQIEGHIGDPEECAEKFPTAYWWSDSWMKEVNAKTKGDK